MPALRCRSEVTSGAPNSMCRRLIHRISHGFSVLCEGPRVTAARQCTVLEYRTFPSFRSRCNFQVCFLSEGILQHQIRSPWYWPLSVQLAHSLGAPSKCTLRVCPIRAHSVYFPGALSKCAFCLRFRISRLTVAPRPSRSLVGDSILMVRTPGSQPSYFHYFRLTTFHSAEALLFEEG